MPHQPAWRRGFDRVERIVGRPLERVVDTSRFAEVLVLAFRAQGVVGRLAERQTRAALHLCNIPSRSDVKRINRQLAVLANEIRRLSEQIEGAVPSPQSRVVTGSRAKEPDA
jgi:hypothetical protein